MTSFEVRATDDLLGRRARYLGLRKNLFDLRRHAAIINLEAIHRVLRAA